MVLKPQQLPLGMLSPGLGSLVNHWPCWERQTSPSLDRDNFPAAYYRRGGTGKQGGIGRGEGMGCQDRSLRHPAVNRLWSLWPLLISMMSLSSGAKSMTWHCKSPCSLSKTNECGIKAEMQHKSVVPKAMILLLFWATDLPQDIATP